MIIIHYLTISITFKMLILGEISIILFKNNNTFLHNSITKIYLFYMINQDNVMCNSYVEGNKYII